MQHKTTIIGNKLFFAILVLCAVVLGAYELSAWQKRQKIEQEIEEVASEAREYEKKNHELSESLAFLGSTASRERIARQQLNMKKDGEIVVSFPETSIEETKKTQEQQRATTSNAQKWWEYFFGERTN